jgi:DNA anti-recombination protein RmuC
MNHTNSTKPSVPLSTHSNLLGKVDLDDEDDLLTKYQTKKPLIELNEKDHHDEFTSSMNKFNSNIQTMIDSKWNQYKTSFHHDEEEQDEEEDLYSTSRQRTSSRSSTIHSKIPSIQPKTVGRSLMIDFIANICLF